MILILINNHDNNNGSIAMETRKFISHFTIYAQREMKPPEIDYYNLQINIFRKTRGSELCSFY